MNPRSFLFIFFLLPVRILSAQPYKFLVHFRDKNNSPYTISNPSAFLSDKSIQRRLKFHIEVNTMDLPVTPAYIDSLNAVPAVHLFNISKWFNQVLLSVPDTSMLTEILKFSFVVSVEPVNNRRVKKFRDSISVNRNTQSASKSISANIENLSVNPGSGDYGASAAQIQIHHGNYLHDLGYHGESMTIAILDDGFNNYLNNPAFDSLRTGNRILGTYDFVHQKINVNDEATHGANCFSIIGSNMPGFLVGSAPAATYWLFKTEDDNSETPVEEQNWVAAAEFADSVGADLITTSLGYSYFDDTAYNLNYPERDGSTALVTRAANLAVARGMIVTASAGNSGNNTSELKYVICPADGDSVYAVGAVDATGLIAGFSSWGPNASGQVKPDGVSVGLGTDFIGPDGNIYAGNGTSFSNPNLAGLITCLWQAFPAFAPMEILSAVRQSSDKYNHPDNRYGYGLPDFEKAYQLLKIKSYPGLLQSAGNEKIYVFPVPFLKNINIYLNPTVTGTASIQLLDVSGKIILTEYISITANLPRLFEFKLGRTLATGVYFIRYIDPQYSKTLKLLKE